MQKVRSALCECPHRSGARPFASHPHIILSGQFATSNAHHKRRFTHLQALPSAGASPMLGTLCLSISLLDEPLFLSPLHIIEVGEITSKTVCFSGSEWSTGIRNTHYPRRGRTANSCKHKSYPHGFVHRTL